MENFSAPRSKFLGLRIAFFLIVVPAFLLAAWTWSALHISYSTGERAGYVQKISLRGWLCKTWEGELAMATMPGVMPQIFNFTVRDDATAKTLEQRIGQRVSIHYEQHRGVPTNCFGETQYFVTSVTPVTDNGAFPSASSK